MTALGAPASVPRKGEALIEEYDVKGTVTVYTGANIVFNGGYVQPAAGLASLAYAGVARSGTVTASTTDGARSIPVQRSGQVQKVLAGATVADIGKEVWMTDDNVITLIPNDGPKMGKITALVSAGVVIVDITGYTAAPPVGPVHIRIPFVKKTAEFDSTYDLPSRMLVEKVFPEVVDNVAASTITVGLLSTESGGDADGFVIAASCANAGIVLPVQKAAAEASLTLGALLNEGNIQDDGAGDYGAVKKDHYAGSVTAKSLSYTTTDHAITGFIHVIGRMI